MHVLTRVWGSFSHTCSEAVTGGTSLITLGRVGGGGTKFDLGYWELLIYEGVKLEIGERLV